MRIKTALAVALCLFLSACIGGAPPQRFLRIADPDLTLCEPAQDPETTAEPYVIAIKTFDSLPSLDRTNVLLGNGRVLAPSHSWYWEGSPAETLTMAVAEHIAYSGELVSAWPYRPRIQRDAVLDGRVLTFALDLSQPVRFTAALKVELWDARSRVKSAEQTFEVSREVPMSADDYPEDPHALAKAAGFAVCELGELVRIWVEDNTARLPRE
jgi:hypothetical protein